MHPAIADAKRAVDERRAAAKPVRARPARPAPTAPPAPTARPEVARADSAEADAGTTATEPEGDTAPVLDEWRDMAGDATTYVEAQVRGVHAQCTLASVRNLRRNPDYGIRRLAERCVGAEYMDDIRCPDWPVLMEPMLRAGEVVKRVAVTGVGAEEMGDFRAGVIIVVGHVMCFHSDGDGAFRVYDNDSAERKEGRPRRMRADEIMDANSAHRDNAIIGILGEASDLSRRLGPALTSLFHARRRPR